MIVDLGREPAIGLKRGYPPERAPGATHSGCRIHATPRPYATHFGVQVLIGGRITANGRHRFRRVAVDYRVRDRRLESAFRRESPTLRTTDPVDVRVRGRRLLMARRRTASTATPESPP